MDENGEFIITAIIVGAIVGAVVGAYIGGSQANGTYNPFKWNFNNVDTWIGMVGGATGALTTPKGHNIWTGREIQQPVQTLETTPMGVHLDVENNITGNLELKAPTSVSLEIQQPKLISIETPDGGIKLISQFSESSIDKGVRLTMSQKELHIFANKLHPKPWLNDLSTKMGGNQNVIESILRNVSGKIQPNTSGVFQVSTTIDGIQIYVRGYINQGVPIINTVYIPK